MPGYVTRQRAVPEENKTMTKSFYAGSAKIYQFPAKMHPDLSSRSEGTKTSEILRMPNLAPVRAGKTSFGSAWYHEEAIQEAKAASKN
jgi:Protein of unknown function (DUF2735)